MDLQRKFAATTTTRTVPINSLVEKAGYMVLFAERIATRFGPSVLLTLLLDPPHTAKVFIPERYGILFSDDDIHEIQQGRIGLRLVYMGTCPLTKSFELAIENMCDIGPSG
jgi:hypothetical protein